MQEQCQDSPSRSLLDKSRYSIYMYDQKKVV